MICTSWWSLVGKLRVAVPLHVLDWAEILAQIKIGSAEILVGGAVWQISAWL